MKRVVISLAIVVVMVLAACAFVAWELNPGEWGTDTRVFAVLAIAAFWVPIIGIHSERR